jgi:hypothetical protein
LSALPGNFWRGVTVVFLAARSGAAVLEVLVDASAPVGPVAFGHGKQRRLGREYPLILERQGGSAS